MQFPVVAQFLWLKQCRTAFDEQRARAFIFLACSSRLHGSAAGRLLNMHARACAVVASAALICRNKHIEQQLVSQSTSVGLPALRVAMLTTQFDETSQRLRGFIKKKLKGERETKAQMHTTIQVMSGRIDTTIHFISSPWCAKSLRLEGQSADFIVDGLSRGMPVWVDSPQMMEFAWQNDVFILFFANDRAAANFKALGYIIEEVLKLPESVLPWCEVCGAHGVAIVKTMVQ